MARNVPGVGVTAGRFKGSNYSVREGKSGRRQLLECLAQCGGVRVIEVNFIGSVTESPIECNGVSSLKSINPRSAVRAA